MKGIANVGFLDGPSMDKLISADGDVGILRPFEKDGKTYISVMNKHSGKREVHRVPYNAAALPYETWLMIDQVVQRAATAPMRAVDDLRSAGLVLNIPNGFAVPALMQQRSSRVGTAQVGMYPEQAGPKDRPSFDTVVTPLPCTWVDWGFGSREIAVSKRGGQPLDMSSIEDGARACGEMAEQMLLGNSGFDQFSYLNASIYGYTDFGSRNTFTVTDPSTSAWTGNTLHDEILAGRQALINDYMMGPYMVYLGSAWAQYLDEYFTPTYAGVTNAITVRQSIKSIDGIQDVRELFWLTGWDVLIVRMNQDTIREIVGMDWTPIQWEEQGGQVVNGRIIGIMVPQPRADYNGKCGIAHGSTA